jgi:hypothetical protein
MPGKTFLIFDVETSFSTPATKATIGWLFLCLLSDVKGKER